MKKVFKIILSDFIFATSKIFYTFFWAIFASKVLAALICLGKSELSTPIFFKLQKRISVSISIAKPFFFVRILFSDFGRFFFVRKSFSNIKSNFSKTIYLLIFSLLFSNCSFSKEKGLLPELLALRALLSSAARAIANFPQRTGFRLGANITGLSSGTLVLKNGSETLSINANGQFFFVARFQTGTNFSVTLDTTPEGNICTLNSSSGTIASVDSFVNVVCSPGPIVYSGQYWLTNPFSIPAINTDILRVTTFAGIGIFGSNDSPGPRFGDPIGLTTDGVYLYVGDYGNRRIRKIEISTGLVSTIVGAGAGSDDGIGLAATIEDPRGMTCDGKNVYIADRVNHNIRKIEIATNTVTTLAGPSACGGPCASGNALGIGSVARFNQPTSLTYLNGFLYIYDGGNNRIKKLDLNTNDVTDFAGSGVNASTDGIGVSADIAYGTAITSSLTHLYFAENSTSKIRRIDISTGAVLTIAGGGSNTVRDGATGISRLKFPRSLLLDKEFLYALEPDGVLRKITLNDNYTTTIFRANNNSFLDGESEVAGLCGGNNCGGLATDGKSIYFSDSGNNSIRKFSEDSILKYRLSSIPTAGSIVEDSSANNLSGTVNGALTQVTDIHGNTAAWNLDGSPTANFSTLHNSIFDTKISATNEFSLSFWINPKTHQNATFISKFINFNMDGFYVQYYNFLPNTAHLEFCQGSGGASICSSTRGPNLPNILQLNVWQHIAITKSSGNIVKIYLNGTNLNVTPDTVPHVALVPNTANITYGNKDYAFNGGMDAIRMYSVELSSLEVAREAINVPSGLVAYFPFNNQVNSGLVSNVTHFANESSSNTGTAVKGRLGLNNTAINFAGAENTSFPVGSANYENFPSGNQDFSICAWGNSTTVSSAFVNSLISFGSPFTEQATGIGVMKLGATDQFIFSNFNSNPRLNFVNLGDRWHFYCNTYESATNTVRFYLDGSLVQSSVILNFNLVPANMRFGQYFTGGDQFFGSVDDIRIYVRRLADNEILALSNFGNRRLFLTSNTATGGSFGSVANINTNICRNDPGNPNGGPTGNWKAMISDDTNQRACTTPNCTNILENISWAMSPHTTYLLPTSPIEVLKTNSAGIPILPLANPLILTADTYWTGTDANWTQNVNNCSNWSNDLFNSPIGIGNSTNNGFIDSGVNVACSASLRLVCVEQY